MKNESKQKQIFIRVDKPIEPGDLVRCIEDDSPCRVGDIRKVRRVYRYIDTFMTTQLFTMYQESWEVVHKLKVGDLVEFNKDGEPMKVTAVNPELNYFWTGPQTCAWTADENIRLYQNSKTEWGINTFPIEPVKAYDDFSELTVTRDGVYVGKLSFIIAPDPKAEMHEAVAEMIVELVDKRGFIALDNLRVPYGEFVVRNISRERIGEAELHPNDTWDTLTGLLVALSKATGRKLPDWIYGKEDRLT